ncbi:hypothetical protein AB4Z19_19375 [Pseudoduganella sp. RAF19]
MKAAAIAGGALTDTVPAIPAWPADAVRCTASDSSSMRLPNSAMRSPSLVRK